MSVAAWHLVGREDEMGAIVRLLSAPDRPVCLAVDDVQWLDAASLSALRFALARLERERIAALLAIHGDPPAWLVRAIPADRLQTVNVGGLSLGATREPTWIEASRPCLGGTSERSARVSVRRLVG